MEPNQIKQSFKEPALHELASPNRSFAPETRKSPGDAQFEKSAVKEPKLHELAQPHREFKPETRE